MSKHGTILGHVVGWGLSRRYEDAATEGLAYLLQHYAPMRQQFVALLRAAQPGLPPELYFGTQHSAAEGRPDMVGRAGEDIRVFVENKFWAALTDNQPLGYLRALQQFAEPSCLLLVVPRPRVVWIWRELLERLKSAEVAWQEVPDGHQAWLTELVTVGQVRMGITTWDVVLGALRASTAEDSRALADLDQLAGLCQLADEDATRPLVREELCDPQIPARIMQYGTIAQEAVERGRKDFLSTEQLRTGHTWTSLGRYFQFVGENAPGAWLGVDFELWRKYEVGPMWLEFGPGKWGQAPRVRERLSRWVEQNGRVLCELPNGGAALHIELPAGREHASVVRAVVDQLRAVHRLLVVENHG
ncbi:hypothetical protein [Nannocystis pusilla]|uniref:hypothetical protein n=1 Tax=Nannocystis pusilla TaxID=889268 RepID=UPI003DA2BC7E